MIHQLLANFVALVHFAFIVFVLFGGLLALRWRWVPWIHLPAAVWGASVEFLGWFCPLTPLENFLRRAGGSDGYTGGFIERYLLPIIYPAQLTREIQVALGAALLVVNFGIYIVVWFRFRDRKEQ